MSTAVSVAVIAPFSRNVIIIILIVSWDRVYLNPPDGWLTLLSPVLYPNGKFVVILSGEVME